MSVVSACLTIEIKPRGRLLLGSVEAAARTTSRPARPLHLQALLQLPRIADTQGFAPAPMIDKLVTELALELPTEPEWLVPVAVASPRLLQFHEVDPDRARDVMRRFHYLRSPRMDGRAYGLSTPDGCLVALCVSSPLDVKRLGELLFSHGRPVHAARVVSRVFAFEGAPTNTISYMLSRAARVERSLGVSDFVTYVNPNMGFTGSSYRASNWNHLGIELGTTYRYIDGRYMTDRELTLRFGSHDDGAYRRILGPRFAVSTMPLEPLLVFHTKL